MKHFVTVPEAAEIAGCSASRIYNYIDMEAIDYKKSSNRKMIDVEQITKPTRTPSLEELNADEVKKIHKLLEILAEYFPIDYLKQTAFDKFHDDIINFLKKEV